MHSITLSNNINNNILTFENYLVDQIPEAENFQPSSILMPLLFLIYINDINNSSNILSFVLFAVDTTVHFQHDLIDGAIQILNSELAKLAEWFDSNKLTQMLMVSRKKNLNHHGDVILRNEAIQRVTKAKFLGIIIVDT